MLALTFDEAVMRADRFGGGPKVTVDTAVEVLGSLLWP
jgi:hypothetical protein